MLNRTLNTDEHLEFSIGMVSDHVLWWQLQIVVNEQVYPLIELFSLEWDFAFYLLLNFIRRQTNKWQERSHDQRRSQMGLDDMAI